ncbi:MAG: PAS domain-containing protein [Wenzhouxiangellaceae bacterium]|nr:MAG: PAS domain-containing protein [Wenzhouxiangella sp.]TVR99318.1 MAG: PAS domain-containing protein [Wenzhouxiangellaceae bacterium]
MEKLPLEPELRQDLIDHLATAILVFDANAQLLWMNAAAETLLGVSARQVLGGSAEMLWPESIDLNLAITDIATSGQAMAFRELTLLPRSQDQPMRVDCVISALPVRAGPSQVVIEMQLSDRDHTLVRDADSDAQQRLAHRMVRNLAHELRNPLAGLRGAAQLLERKLDRAELKEYTRIIIGEADRLGTLVSQLLGPQQLPRPQAVNLHRPLEHVRRLFAAGDTNSIKIERDYDPSLPRVQVDPDQLVQALLNLLRNAGEALADSAQGRIKLRTRVVYNLVIGGRSHRQCARISVIDNGPGIAPDQIERIFFPMVSGHPQRTGLGLAIARGLIGANDGRIDCSSRPGRTEFMIDLPLGTETPSSTGGDGK